MKIVTDNKQVNNSVSIAFDDINGNIKEFNSSYDGRLLNVLMAGADYDTPWTRDASINVYNGFCFMNREVSLNTLMSVLEKREEKTYIGGQYWDAIIWALGAYQYYLVSHDTEFLNTAYEAISNSLSYYEENEFSEDYQLFRGPAVYGDGVSAYPHQYGFSGKEGCILGYVNFNKDKINDKGYGIPMHTLSTNAVYCIAYDIAEKMASVLNRKKEADDFSYHKENLKKVIRKHFVYDGERLKYIVGRFGDCLRQEGLGISFASMANIVDIEAFEHIFISKYGIPCVFPNYSRYNIENEYGRHCGTIWPHVQCFFANEALKQGKHDMFDFEFKKLTELSNRDKQFYEIYHPDTGEIYGGLQEHWKTDGLFRLKSCEHQTWSATGYLSLLLYGFGGLNINEDKIVFNPYLNEMIAELEFIDLKINEMSVNLKVKGKGNMIESIKVNGESVTDNCLRTNLKGEYNIHIMVRES
ncbi:MAG: hypothetical protein JXQ23_09910 [Clostridia bacterium]|nr:hypothetical protein [Clostridia bacterium]